MPDPVQGGGKPKVYHITHKDDRCSYLGDSFEANAHWYTKINVFDKDSGRQYELYTPNCVFESGTGTKYTVKNGRVFDKDGKPVANNILTLNRYHAAILEAAAAGGEYASVHKLNEFDMIGSRFEDVAENYLQKNKSEFHITEAEASGGWFTAYTENKKGEKGASFSLKFTDERK